MTSPGRCLVLVRAGDRSVHEEWLEPTGRRQFDLAVSYYGAHPGTWADRADHYRVQAGPKWPCVADWLDENWSWVSAYDYLAVPDDDLSADASVWTATFETMAEYGLDLAQPSFGADSNWVHPITAQRPGPAARITNFIENGLAVFSQRALRWCAPVMRLGSSGVGTDYAWTAITRRAGGRVGIVDRVCVHHVRAHHGAGGSAHQSLGSLASVLRHPELLDELLLMATFGIGNPYDPFVEQQLSTADQPAGATIPAPPVLASSTVPGPVTFVVVGSGTIDELGQTLESVVAAAAAEDELIVVDATFDSHLQPLVAGICDPASRGRTPVGTPTTRILTAPDEGLAACYDLALRSATNPVAVIVASGWTIGPHLRAAVSAWSTDAGSTVLAATGAPVGAVRRDAVAGMGGMRGLSQVVTTGFGKVGTGELLEAARSMDHRSRVLPPDSTGGPASPASLSPAASPSPPAFTSPAGPVGASTGADRRPTRDLSPELRDAVQATGLGAILALGDLVSEGQRDAYHDLARAVWPQARDLLAAPPDAWPADVRDAVVAGPFRTTRLLRALVRRGNVDQAARLLAVRGLAGAQGQAEVDEAVAIARAGGLPLPSLAEPRPGPDPRLAIARDPNRPPHERAAAVSAVVAASRRRAERLLQQTTSAAEIA